VDQQGEHEQEYPECDEHAARVEEEPNAEHESLSLR
jgi:hypothetical protein